MNPHPPAKHGELVTHDDLARLYTGRNLVAPLGEYPQVLAPKDYPLVLGANASKQTVLEISGGSTWVFETLRATSTGAFLCMVRDASSTVALMNKPIHSANLFGTAQRPGFITERSWEVHPGDGIRSLTIDLTDLSGATNTVYFEFLGHRYATSRYRGRTGGN